MMKELEINILHRVCKIFHCKKSKYKHLNKAWQKTKYSLVKKTTLQWSRVGWIKFQYTKTYQDF